MVRVVSQLGSVMLLSLYPIMFSLPSYAHGSKTHRPKKEIRVSDETTSHDPNAMMSDEKMFDEKMSNEKLNQEAMMENNVMSEKTTAISDTPAIAEESKSNSSPQPAPVQAAGIMPQGLGETLFLLLVTFPLGLYALKHR